MNKLIISGAILMALIFPALAQTIIVNPPIDGCITKEVAAERTITEVTDAIGVVTGNTVTFSAPFRPTTVLVQTFDNNGCLIKLDVIPKTNA